MKLFYTTTSPFVRKVHVAAVEIGIKDLELITLRPSPLEANATLSSLNPLNKIPALVLDDGDVLYDSRVICDYLDAQSGGKLIPSGPKRFATLKVHALCDGILEAAILIFYEKANRPAELHFKPWLDGQEQKARQGLAALNEWVKSKPTFDLASIAAACALEWLDFRQPFGDVRGTYKEAYEWLDVVSSRPSLAATRPRT